MWGAAPLYTLSLEEPTPLYKTGEVDFFCFVAFDAGVTTPARGGVSADPRNMPRPSFKQGGGGYGGRGAFRDPPTHPPVFKKTHTPTHPLLKTEQLYSSFGAGRQTFWGWGVGQNALSHLFIILFTKINRKLSC